MPCQTTADLSLIVVSVADPRGWEGLGDLCPPPPPLFGIFFFFYKSEVYLAKISIKWVQNLSQNAGNGHFRDSKFQNFLGGGMPKTPTIRWQQPYIVNDSSEGVHFTHLQRYRSLVGSLIKESNKKQHNKTPATFSFGKGNRETNFFIWPG